MSVDTPVNSTPPDSVMDTLEDEFKSPCSTPHTGSLMDTLENEFKSPRSTPHTGSLMDTLENEFKSPRSTPHTARSTPMLSSTPKMRRTPSLKGSAKFKVIDMVDPEQRSRTSSSASHDDTTVIAFKNLLQEKLLITEETYVDDEDDFFELRNGRMSRDTDYETDLDMDYDEWIAEETNELKIDAAPDKKYIHVCNETGTIPSSYFLRHIQDTRFRMRYHGLGPLGAKALALPLRENHFIEILDLEGNWIEKEGAGYLSEMLRENTYLSEVNIAENKLGRDGADAICLVLSKNEFLKSLNMSGNNLQDYGAERICEMLQKNITLKHLYLSHNKFEERAAFAFKEALGHNESIETLDLSWNHFRTNGALAIAEGVQENYGLKCLNISMNGFSDIGAEAMGRALKHNRGLAELDISHNRITEQGAGHVALGLQTNDNLKVLKIGFNPVGEDGPMALIVAISKNDQSCMSQLDLADVFVTQDFRNIQKRLESERIITITHAGVLNEKEEFPFLDTNRDDVQETFRRNPYEKLKNYAKAAGYRLMDLFKDFDKDGSMTITKDEFERGLQLAGVEITKSEIDQVIKKLDANNDGMIDYSELVQGDQEYRKELKENEQCPDDRRFQKDSNRFRRKQSEFLEKIINS